MKYDIAIPSYKRSKLLKEKTLKILSGIPIENITIFVRNQEELDDYTHECDETDRIYNYIITEASGIKNTRNFIRTYYHKKELDVVLFIDDDIDKLHVSIDKKTSKSVENLEETLEYMYNETKKRNLFFFGICGFNNPFFMSDTITTNLKYIIGAFCGIIEPHRCPLVQTSIEHGEDYEFTMKHFLTDGGVVRFNNYCITTKYYREEGGICFDLGGITKRNENAKESLTQLETEYSDMCKVVQKKNGMWDLKLNYRYSRGKKKAL